MFSFGESNTYQRDYRSESISSEDGETNLMDMFASWQKESTIVSLGWGDYPAVVSESRNCTNHDIKFGTFTADRRHHQQSDSEASAPGETSMMNRDNDDQPRTFWSNGACGVAARNVRSLFIQQSGTKSHAVFHLPKIWDSESSAPDTVDTSDEDSDDLSQIDVEPTHRNCDVQCQTELPTSPQSINIKIVRFSTVHIREYSITLGDHPLAISYPLSLDWTFTEDSNCTVSVDEFDERRIRRRADYDNEYETFVPSRGMLFKAFPKPPQLDVMERRSRLVDAMGLTYEKLDQLERQRKADDRRS